MGVLRNPQQIVMGRAGSDLEGAMKVSYDRDVDVMRIIFTDAPIAESDEDKPGVILDYDAVGNIVGMEILDASKRITNPRRVEYTEES